MHNGSSWNLLAEAFALQSYYKLHLRLLAYNKYKGMCIFFSIHLTYQINKKVIKNVCVCVCVAVQNARMNWVCLASSMNLIFLLNHI